MSSVPRPTRRAVLLGTLALPLAGCRQGAHHAGASPALASRDAEALRSAYGAEARIVAAYEALGDSLGNGDLTLLDAARGEHREHLDALAAMLGTPRPTAAAAPRPPAPGPELRRAVVGGAGILQRQAVDVSDGDLGALLASIAASHLSTPPTGRRRAAGGSWFGSAFGSATS